LKLPAIIGNRELVEYFIQYLDANFREALNSRLSLQGHLRVDALGRSHVKDLYALDQVVQKAVDLVSDKTIARALQHSATLGVSTGKLDPDSRAPVLFMKQEATRKVDLLPDLESLQMDMNVLKTMYEKQEKGQEKHEKHIQSLIESIHALVSRSRYQREFLPPLNQNQYQNQNRYTGPLGPVPLRPSRKCYYCFGTNHLFLNYMVKNEDKQKKLILVDSFTVKFANGDPILTDPNLSIRKYVKKHLPSSVVVMLISNQDLELAEFLDREPNTGYNQNKIPKTILKRLQVGPPRKE